MSDDIEAMKAAMHAHGARAADRHNERILDALLRSPALFRRPIPEIRARAATSRYWAQRLRWLRKRGRA